MAMHVERLLHPEGRQQPRLQCVQEAFAHQPILGLRLQSPLTTQVWAWFAPSSTGKDDQEGQGQFWQGNTTHNAISPYFWLQRLGHLFRTETERITLEAPEATLEGM